MILKCEGKENNFFFSFIYFVYSPFLFSSSFFFSVFSSMILFTHQMFWLYVFRFFFFTSMKWDITRRKNLFTSEVLWFKIYFLKSRILNRNCFEQKVFSRFIDFYAWLLCAVLIFHFSKPSNLPNSASKYLMSYSK